MRLIGLAVVLVLGLALAQLVAEAQQAKVPTVGVLVAETLGSTEFQRHLKEALRQLGYVEGQNIRFELRSDQGKTIRLPELAAELVGLKVDIIVTWLTPAGTAAKRATPDIPIVCAICANPVETGLVASLARPGGNFTGIAGVGAELSGKCVELIREMLPSARRVGALANAPDPFSKLFLERIRRAGEGTGTTIDPILVRGPEGLDAAFRAMLKDRPDAVIVQPTLGLQRPAELALENRLPAVSIFREFVENGGLMSYSVVEADIYRRAGLLVDKILKGAKPADLPVEQPTKFELVINLKTAKALRLTIPQTFLLRADQVIE
jgi:putative tryptophan/tyrosine transport system substrate-binding protein